jgi:hypothetical protein
VKNLAVTNAEFPLTNDLLGFLRIFCVTEGKIFTQPDSIKIEKQYHFL